MLQRSFPQAIGSIVTNPLVAGFLVMLCAALLVLRVYGLMASPSPTNDLTQIPSRENVDIKTLDVNQLVILNLFGDTKNKTVSEQKTAADDIPETRLKLILKGAFTSTENEVSSALIATDQRNQAERYYVGDELPGNAVLHEVTSNNVVLKRGGKLEKLLFPRGQSVANTGAPSRGFSVNQQRPKPRTVIEGNESSLKNRLQQLRKQLNDNEDNIRI